MIIMRLSPSLYWRREQHIVPVFIAYEVCNGRRHCGATESGYPLLDRVLHDAAAIARQLSEEQRRAVAGGLAVLGKRMLDQDMFPQFMEMLMKTELGHPLLDQRYEEGRQEGRQEGVQEGVLIGIRQAILDILAVRGIRVPGTFRGTLDRITVLDALNALKRDAMEAHDSADFLARSRFYSTEG